VKIEMSRLGYPGYLYSEATGCDTLKANVISDDRSISYSGYTLEEHAKEGASQLAYPWKVFYRARVQRMIRYKNMLRAVIGAGYRE
jgi:hypothetical protein